jgi:hypothetical protein
MNAKIWGAIAVALVLGACGGKQEEAAPAATEEAAPAATEVAPATDVAPAADAAATDAAAAGDAAAAPAEDTAAPAQ